MDIYDPEKITFFAKTDARGANVPFGIKAKDRTRHMYVIGKTGMGKSTLLENMAVQDMQNGEGMAFIDPHGQTAETLLDYVPESRKDDVLYFAPFDTDYPVAFNVMEDVGPDRRHLVVSGLMSVFKKIWIDAWSARMEYILQNTLLALLEYPDSTLLGVNRMLSDKKYRRKVIDNISDPAVKSFWVDEFLNYNERYMQEAGDAIKNKIGQFTANPLIRNIIGQPKSSFDMRQIMDEKKILIMNLSKGLIGESNANLLGSMLTTRIYLAAMSRADLAAEQMKTMPNFYFYVDEFQSFANATFADILSEARKYKLNLTIAHQYIEQMEEEVRNAVFGNVGTIVSFRVGPFDAEVLETIYAPQFYAVDICNLGFAQVYMTLMIDGIGSKPFSATTLPPIAPKSESCKQMVIHASRTQFAFARKEVEEKINAWHAADPVEQNKSDNHPAKSAGDERRPKFDNQRSDRGREERKNSVVPQRTERPRDDKSFQPPLKRVESSPAPEDKKPEITEKPAEQKPNNQKHLDELRSILKQLTASEPLPPKESRSKNLVSKTKSTERTTDTNQDKKAAPDSLRAALASVIPEVNKEPTQAAKQPLSSPSKTASEVSRPVASKREETESSAPPPNPPIATGSVFDKSAKPDPLDPKKLERMMRVTTGDRTSLK